MKNKPFEDFKQEILQDKEVLFAYSELEPQYQIIRELIQYRTLHHISQSELARRTGIPKSNISRFESGKHSPTLTMVYRIAEGLNKKITFSLSNRTTPESISVK
jgi:transcriptional regulator with XRE-family HTH domain